MSTKTLVGIALAFILVGATRLFAQNPDDARAIVSFQRAADEYAFLHRRIERQQPPLEIGSDAETLNRAIESMAAARGLYARSGFRARACALGATGHFGCDRFYELDL